MVSILDCIVQRRYQSWNLIIPSGIFCMTLLRRRGLPLSYLNGQASEYMMASGHGYFLAGLRCLLCASSEGGTSFTWFLGLNWSWQYHLCTEFIFSIGVKIGLIMIGILSRMLGSVWAGCGFSLPWSSAGPLHSGMSGIIVL